MSPNLHELPPINADLAGWPWTETTTPVVPPVAPPPAAPPPGHAWPRISIVVTSYEQGDYLEETLRSVLLQAYPELELIVVDGGSRDASTAVLERYAPWLAHWTSESDRGQSDAINKGFARATGEIVTFLGSDDVYEPGALHDVARRFLAQPGCGAIVGAFRFMDAASKRLPEVHLPRLPGPGPQDLTLLEPASWRLHQVATFYTRHALDAVGRHVREDLRYTMDRELLYRVARRFPIVLAEPCYAAFRRHPASKSVAAILPMSREMGQLHLLAADADEPAALGRQRRRLARHHRARGQIKRARSEAGRLPAAAALCRALTLRPSLAWKRSFLVAWLEVLGLAGPFRQVGKTRLVMIVLLVVSLVAKLAVAANATDDPGRFATHDTRSYLEPALALLATGHFAVSAAEPDHPETLRTPGYPLFLAAVFAAVGPRPLAAVVAQVFLSLVTIVFVHRLGAALGGRRVGVVAALLLVLDVTTFAYSLMLLTETVFAVLLATAGLVAVRFADRPADVTAALLGLLLGASVLVRPINDYLLLPMAVWIAWTSLRRGLGRRRSAALVLVFALPWVTLVGGWRLRNRMLTGTAILSRIEGVNLLFYRGAAIVARRDGIDIHEARRRLEQGRGAELRGTPALGPEAQSARDARRGVALIAAHPGIFLRTQVEGLAALGVGLGQSTLWRLLGRPSSETSPLGDLRRLAPGPYFDRWIRERPSAFLAFVLEEMHLAVLYAGIASWALRVLRRRRFTLADGWFWLVLVYLAVLSAGPEAHARFRVPLAPFLAVYGAVGLLGHPSSPRACGSSVPSA